MTIATTGLGGFTPKGHIYGAPYNGRIEEFLKDSTDSSILQIGDVVILDGTSGATGVVVSGRDVEGVLRVTRATATNSGQNIQGVVVGFIMDQAIPSQQAPASSARIVLVETSPDVLLEVTEDGNSTALIATDMGLNISYNLTAGDTTSFRSGMTIISTSRATTSTFPFKVLNLTKRPGNTFATAPAGARFDVTFNTHVYFGNITTT